MLNRTIKKIYSDSALSILELLQMIVLEVHYIKQEIIEDNTIDILFIIKKDENIHDYLDILIADGFNFLQEKTHARTVMLTNQYNNYTINYYFINDETEHVLLRDIDRIESVSI